MLVFKGRVVVRAARKRALIFLGLVIIGLFALSMGVRAACTGVADFATGDSCCPPPAQNGGGEPGVACTIYYTAAQVLSASPYCSQASPIADYCVISSIDHDCQSYYRCWGSCKPGGTYCSPVTHPGTLFWNCCGPGYVCGTLNCVCASGKSCTNSTGPVCCTSPTMTECAPGGICCTPETDAAFCSRLGKTCGPVTNVADNCGVLRTVASCGTCNSPPDACYISPGTCSSGACSYSPKANGASCGGTSLCCAGGCRADPGWACLADYCNAKPIICGPGQWRADLTSGLRCTYNTTASCHYEWNTGTGGYDRMNCSACNSGGHCVTTCTASQTCCAVDTCKNNCKAYITAAGGSGPCDSSPCLCPAPKVDNSSSCCTPETDAAFCSRLGKNCGSVTANDNCGNSRTVSCGSSSCSNGYTCSGSNVCTCVSGTVCSGTCCSSGQVCYSGSCCTVSSWSPLPSTVCSGTGFTQTSNCGTTRGSTGTKASVWGTCGGCTPTCDQSCSGTQSDSTGCQSPRACTVLATGCGGATPYCYQHQCCNANAGLTCQPTNSCGQYNTGTILCDGTCSVLAPPESNCLCTNPPPSCGNCGTQTCNAGGVWGLPCTGEGCSPGSTRGCAGGLETCSGSCSWSGVCVQFVCTGGVPADAVPCAGDDAGLSADTSRSVVAACTAPVKCEYTCDLGYYASGGVCVPYVCTGGVPSNAVLCGGDDVGLSADTLRSSTDACTVPVKCEYLCGVGYHVVGGVCVPYVCTGVVPSNAGLCAGDDTGLSADTARSVVGACGALKCEYTCNAGYYASGGVCVPYVCTGVVPSNAALCAGDDVGLSADTARSSVDACGALKCEYLCGAGYHVVGGVCVPYVCTGSNPANAALCSGDDAGLSADTSKAVVAACTAGTKCEYTCDAGYYASGGVCVPYVCTGGVPSNAVLCAGDDTGLSADTARSVVSACGALKCEYTCNAGYYASGGVCVPYVCTGGVPANAALCAGDDVELSADTARSSVDACAALKCEYQCSAGYHVVGGVCVPYVCTGVVPSNATLCAGDDTGLSADTLRSAVAACTAPAKCEYTCDVGYYASGGVCVAYVCTGSAPANADFCAGDNTGLGVDTPRSLVAACGVPKCEYTCSNGYALSGGVCVLTSTTWEGYLIDGRTNTVITDSGAHLTIDSSSQPLSFGHFSASVSLGQHVAAADAPGYDPVTYTYDITSSPVHHQNITLSLAACTERCSLAGLCNYDCVAEGVCSIFNYSIAYNVTLDPARVRALCQGKPLGALMLYNASYMYNATSVPTNLWIRCCAAFADGDPLRAESSIQVPYSLQTCSAQVVPQKRLVSLYGRIYELTVLSYRPCER